MVKKISMNAEKVLYAGDDDQAIHRWTGVDVRLFLGCSDQKEILTQSYRLPVSVHRLSQHLVHRIDERQEKEFKPTKDRGSVNFHRQIRELDFSTGSWTLMARTNAMVREWGELLQAEGLLYSIKGRSSINQSTAEVITFWKKLQMGEHLPLASVAKLYENVPKMGDFKVVKRGSSNLLQAVDPESLLSYEDLKENYGMVAPKDRDAMDVARLGTHDKLYFEAIERRGENFLDEPRIKLSTFHAMKGGEDDNCVVSLSSTRACAENTNQDDEHRAFYVGVTRAKKNLHIIESDKKYRYLI
jgi:superfamily I DNA/RNA helicase